MQTRKLSDSSVALLHPFPHLIIHASDGQQMIPLTNVDFWTIGRDYTNSIILTDKWVSRNHATLQIVGSVKSSDAAIDPLARSEMRNRGAHHEGNFYLVDLSSQNGSFVRGQRVTLPILLKNGDRLTIGKTEMDFYSPQRREHHRAVPDNLRLFYQPTAPVTSSGLTPSESRVFWQVVQGFTNKEIGKRLQISPRTVQTHLSSIMTKLNLENRSQIVRFAYEHNRIPPNPPST
jgi:DNA-binding CsgD family transcriptional regulator